jgi:hypothetical protein
MAPFHWLIHLPIRFSVLAKPVSVGRSTHCIDTTKQSKEGKGHALPRTNRISVDGDTSAIRSPNRSLKNAMTYIVNEWHVTTYHHHHHYYYGNHVMSSTRDGVCINVYFSFSFVWRCCFSCSCIWPR